MVKVLITGAAGQVGSELVKLVPEGFDAIGLDSNELNICDEEQVNRILEKHKPDLIINAAAYTAVDKAENHVELAYSVNDTGVSNIAFAASKHRIPVFHISTDYVFSGTSVRPYKETDPVGPSGVYGSSKLAGERALIDSDIPYIILRTSWVFGAEGNNFVKTMLRLGAEHDELSIVSDQQGCPTSAASIAKVLWGLTERYVADGVLPWGVYHFGNSDRTTWYGFAREIFKQSKAIGLLAKTPILKEVNTIEYPTPAKRPAWSVLDCTKIESFLGTLVPGWRSELACVLRQLNK